MLEGLPAVTVKVLYSNYDSHHAWYITGSILLDQLFKSPRDATALSWVAVHQYNAMRLGIATHWMLEECAFEQLWASGTPSGYLRCS